MPQAGYDIGASPSSSSSAGASLNDAFNITGGGGSLANAVGAQPTISGTGTPTGIASWIPWALIGAVVVAFMVIVFKQK